MPWNVFFAWVEGDAVKEYLVFIQWLLQIRREYTDNMFAEQIKRVQHRHMHLYQRVKKGDEAARLARDEADRRQKELRIHQREKLAELDRLQGNSIFFCRWYDMIVTLKENAKVKNDGEQSCKTNKD